MIVIEFIEEFLLPVFLMIYISLTALVLSKIQHRVSKGRMSPRSIDSRFLVVNERHQEVPPMVIDLVKQ